MEDWTDMDNLTTFFSPTSALRKLPTFHRAEGKVGEKQVFSNTGFQNEQDELRWIQLQWSLQHRKQVVFSIW